MKNYIYTVLFVFALSPIVNAQSTLDSVLISIKENNKTIQANVQLWETKKLEYKTGLTPKNPTVEYDYMIGTPSNSGNQTDFIVNQSFDFPTAYAKKKQLSNEQIAQAEIQLTSIRQTVLLEAKKACIELVYRNKYNSELQKHIENTERWLLAFQKKLNNGEGGILDVNKAKLQLIEVKSTFQENQSAINQLNQKLTELNGGKVIVFTDTVYAQFSLLPDFEALEDEIEANDASRKYLEQEKLISQKQVELSKAMSLPKLETGYHYQAILGQWFNGVHFGLSIPLWENKNKVKAQHAKLLFTDLNLQDHRNEHYYHIKQTYEKQQNLGLIIQNYKTVFNGLNTIELLDKSLKLGQISTIEYFMEITYYYNARKNYLRTEKEYYQVIAELYKHRL